MPQRIHFLSPRWLNQAGYTTNELDLQINKARVNRQTRQLSKFNSIENDSSTNHSRFTKFVRLWSKLRISSKKEAEFQANKSPSIISERIHKSHSVSAFFPPSTCNETPLENIFSPLVDPPMDTIDTIQEDNSKTMAINKRDCRTESNFFNSDFFKDSVRPVIEYDESQITD
ncbi:hypothetical protein Cantr_07123 [Candida viswanathii]|uniref:Uncharacterized protein n=1 Tax=Candida viswanathii TaxID=5486 RepID=A0A367Y1M2_9ASCO|nr:hypothetical protein Cantr_07123 [Candida viswanathii]